MKRLAGDRAISDTTLEIPHPYEDGMAEQWISSRTEQFALGKHISLAITLRATGALIGTIGLGLRQEDDCGELGYWIGVPYWNQGYCTEAAQALIRYAFDDLGMHRVFAEHMVRNPGSGRVMQKAGMTYEGTLRQHVRKWDKYEDLAVYGILRSD